MWCYIGNKIGCFLSFVKDECLSHPPTLRTPSWSTIGARHNNLLLDDKSWLFKSLVISDKNSSLGLMVSVTWQFEFIQR